MNKAIRVDEEVLAKLKSDNKTPNQFLRETFGLPERKHNRKKMAGDNLSKAKRYLQKAVELLEGIK